MKQKDLYLLLMGAALPCSAFAQQSEKEELPNFVWYMTEDVSDCYLKLYNAGKHGADTPNVERLARGGVVFTRAYSNAPVSSAARSTLITGCYGPRLGVSFHRKFEPVGLQEDMHLFPAYLRQIGYFTANARKLDYNCVMDPEAWDIPAGNIGDWRKRKDKDTPFFYVRTNPITHESHLHFKAGDYPSKKTVTDPKEVVLAPNHPDTDLFRYTYATFYDCIRQSDEELGQIIDMLEEDGEMDNTFIFFFGDNGGCLPGTKGCVNEKGLSVPLVVYVPEKWRERLSVTPGSFNEGLVSFMDLGPTLLHLAGLEVPEFMDGEPIFGDDVNEKELKERSVYGYGDRFDEYYTFNRSLSKGDFRYQRNFQPYHPKSLYTKYKFTQLALREWRDLYNQGRLDAARSAFFEPYTAEELYDLRNDPDELVNLAGDPAYGRILRNMRKQLKEYMVSRHDLGFVVECEWLKGASDIVRFGIDHADDIARYSDIADLQLVPFRKAIKPLKKALASSDPMDNYWAATVCASFGKEAEGLKAALQGLLEGGRPYVRSRAAVALRLCADVNPVAAMKAAVRDCKTEAEALCILNDITFIHDHVHPYDFGLTMDDMPPLFNKKSFYMPARIDHLAGLH